MSLPFIDFAQPGEVGVRVASLISVTVKDLGRIFTIRGRRQMRLEHIIAVNDSRILHMTGSTLASGWELALSYFDVVGGGQLTSQVDGRAI